MGDGVTRLHVWAGTEGGLYRVSHAGECEPVVPGRRIVDLAAGAAAGWLALVDGDALWGADGRRVPLPGPAATCLLADNGTCLIGTREAHLVRVTGDQAEPVTTFERAEGRDTWYTPWGGPPDTRSLSQSADGIIYVNVHVGGILRSDDGGLSWTPTIDVDADVHQVLATGAPLLAATAYGLAESHDGGRRWDFRTEGLHAVYARAVAVAGGTVLLSASTGPGGDRSAVYRRPLQAGPGTPFERCREGLPEWFSGNVDTGCLVAHGDTVVLGTGQGGIFRSDDAGASWASVVGGLPRITCLGLAAESG